MGMTPTDPSDLAAAVSDLERRVKAIEAGAGLRNASMQEGTLTIRDPDGDPRVTMGVLADGGYGIEIHDEDSNAMFRVAGEGMALPYIPIYTFDSSDATAYNGGSFVDTRFWAQAETVSHPGLYFWVAAFCEAGVAGEVRISAPGYGTFTSAHSYTATGGSVLKQFRWLHGIAINDGPVQFRVQARRTAGAGNFFVYQPNSAALAAANLCTPTGI